MGKEGENAQRRKDFLEQEIPKGKERKIRVCSPLRTLETLWGFEPKARNSLWENPCLMETGGMLFQEHCFGEENSLSLTEFWGKLGELCKKLGEFALSHK